MKKAYSFFFILLLTLALLPSCAAHKAKKCDCPTFGNNHKHAETDPVKSGKDS